jgi:TatA/E family protein of Tat protein translocase
MFGSIGFPELLVILTIALLVFGPKKLPEIGRSIGKAMREFRKTSDEIKERIEEEINAEEFREMKRDINQLTDFSSGTGSKPSSSPTKPASVSDPYRDLEAELPSDKAPAEEQPAEAAEGEPVEKEKDQGGHDEDEKVS